jgi:hypothetical protein
MESIGILLYGYDEKQAKTLHKQLEQLMDTEVALISGSGRENDVVESIISQESQGDFKDGTPKVLIFLGFSDAAINQVLDGFSTFQDITRPIFCGLTESNIKWPMKQLLNHLIEEQQYWAEQKKK